MKDIVFDEGFKEYRINNDDNRIIKLRIGDPNLLSRLKTAYEEIKALESDFSKSDTEVQIAEVDKRFREIFNAAFDTDICTPAFGGANPLTAVGNKRLYEVFFDAFLPLIEEDITAAAQKLRPEVQKYLPDEGIPDISGLDEQQKKALLAQLTS